MLYCHVITDKYRENLIINSFPENGRVVIDAEDDIMFLSKDLMRFGNVDVEGSKLVRRSVVFTIFSQVCEDPAVKNIFFTNIDDADISQFLTFIYQNLNRIIPNIHFICFDSTSIPFDIKLLCTVREYPPSTFEERLEIFKKYGFKDAERYSRETEGMKLGEVSIVAELCSRGINIEHAITEIKLSKLKEFGLELISKEKDFSEIVISRKLRKTIQEVMDSHEKVSILFVGVTGGGKTYLAKSLLGGYPPSVSVNVANMLSSLSKVKFVGEKKDFLGSIERISPKGILIDQFDLISSHQTSSLDRAIVFDQILGWLENKKFGILLATSVNPEAIDPQVIRPGRFDAVILVPLPGYFERYNILREVGMKSGYASYIAGNFKYYTPADLTNIAKVFGNSPINIKPNREHQKKVKERYMDLVKYVSSLPNGFVIEKTIN